MKPVVEQVRSEYESKLPFEFYNLGNASNGEIANKYGILYIPTLIFIGKDGSVVNKIVGVADKASIEQNVKNIIN
ncbi:MAG: thioredoxin family protein [Firmicutes bacterium]|nr:thioredoxin family protein [Bacillota bacterium]